MIFVHEKITITDEQSTYYRNYSEGSKTSNNNEKELNRNKLKKENGNEYNEKNYGDCRFWKLCHNNEKLS